MTETPQIGFTKDQLDTPALCIDLDRLESNIRTMADVCAQNRIAWRPHSKCHKSPVIAQREIECGAIGVTCAKVGEAEVMAAGGVHDLLIANMIVGPQKLQRLVLLRRQADPIVCIDSLEQAQPLSDAMAQADLRMRVILEVDIGLARVGVDPRQEALDLAKQVDRLPGLQMSGVMGYEGHLLTIVDQQEKSDRIHAALDVLVACKQMLQAAGLPCGIVSCGGTGSFYIASQHPGITEVQAGGGIFMDAFYRHVCQVPHLQYAVTVLTTVVSRPSQERAVTDAGRKTLNQELYMPLVAGRDDVTVESLSAEHGRLRLESSARDLRIGDRLELVPGYVDFTTVLHDEFYGFRGDRLEAIWPIEGRGKIR